MTLTSIPLDTGTRDKLRELGKKGESWDALLKRVIYENTMLHEGKRIVTNEIPKMSELGYTKV